MCVIESKNEKISTNASKLKIKAKINSKSKNSEICTPTPKSCIVLNVWKN